jgi:hypothetical protein
MIHFWRRVRARGAQGPHMAGTRSGHDFNPVLPGRNGTFQWVMRDSSEKKIARGA